MSKSGAGSVAVSGGADCSSSCNFTSGQAVSLIATPSSGYNFVSWGGDCSGSNTNICNLNMTGNKTVSVFFEAIPASSGGGGGGGGGNITVNPIINPSASSTNQSASSTPVSSASNATSSPSSGLQMPAGDGSNGNNPATFPSDSLVLDQGTIYFISGRTKIPFTSMAVFKGLGYKLSNIIAGDSSAYQTSQMYILGSANMAHPLGSWLLYRKPSTTRQLRVWSPCRPGRFS
jgi:hypothetical protein